MKTEAAEKELRGNIEKYLGRAEKIKGFVKDERDGECHVCMCDVHVQISSYIYLYRNAWYKL